ncbi:MAG TPA: hypothetical protein VIY29_02075 [Ktedonobacteraceae bacterium]
MKPTPMRTTEFAPTITPVTEQTADSPALASGYGPPTTATRLGKLAAFRERTLPSNATGH